MSFAPNLFLSNIKAKDGLARPNRFQVILPIPPYINRFIEQGVLEQLINLPNNIVADVTSIVTNALGKNPEDPQSKTSNASISRYLSMQCETAELPGKSLITADAKIYGPGFKVPYQKQYNEITLGFLSTNDFYERKLFDRWIDAIMPSSTNNLRFPKDDATRYMTNIKILQYDDFIKQIYAVELIDAFPVSVAPQPLTWSDDGFHRLSVQFSYQKYKTLYDGNYDLTQAAASIFGVEGAKLMDRIFRF
ncbi:MAG: hypothetical protein ACO239_00410 [Sediminibacterium sp.]